jgi:hypothetical protein
MRIRIQLPKTIRIRIRIKTLITDGIIKKDGAKAYPRSKDFTQQTINTNVFILVPITLTSAKWALPCVSMQACAGWARISQILMVRSHEHEAITFFSLGDHLENRKSIYKTIIFSHGNSFSLLWHLEGRVEPWGESSKEWGICISKMVP